MTTNRDDTPLKTTFTHTSLAVTGSGSKKWQQDTVFLNKHNYSTSSRPWWRRLGWPAGAFGLAILASLAFLINLGVLVWALKSFSFRSGVAEVYAGDCDKSERINTFVHLGINNLSTILLSGSNYCMQILSAPTRKEIDKAHARKRWLEIGVPSVRNLKKVSGSKVLIWWLLGLSSVPLHLMYNSVFFSTLATNSYDIIFATGTFLEDDLGSGYNITKFSKIEETQAQARTWERLENSACINVYADEFVNTHRNVIAVVTEHSTTANDSVKEIREYLLDYSNASFIKHRYSWICEATDGASRYNFTEHEVDDDDIPCSGKVSKVKDHSDRWQFHGWDIEYCMSERAEGRCSLNFSLPIVIIVMLCNVTKAALMFTITFRIKDKPLVTVGDAIDSFLNVIEPTTEGMCLASEETIREGESLNGSLARGIVRRYSELHLLIPIRKLSSNWKSSPVEYRPRAKHWYIASGETRWWTCISLSVFNYFISIRFNFLLPKINAKKVLDSSSV